MKVGLMLKYMKSSWNMQDYHDGPKNKGTKAQIRRAHKKYCKRHLDRDLKNETE